MDTHNAILSDVNPELIECYEEIRSQPSKLAQRLASMPNTEAEYYRIRALKPRSSFGRAARFIYLTSLSFNGIYRQNLLGEFNVPYGYKLTKELPTLSEVERASSALTSAKLLCADFEEASADANHGDVVYCDPPYTVAHNNNGFVKYNASIFSWEDQKRLAQHMKVLAARGCTVAVSNADHWSVRELYRGFEVRVLRRHSVIAASSRYRVPVTECLFISKPKTTGRRLSRA